MPLGILGGTLLASALQGIFGIGSTIAANKYNSPLAMKRRLREAGLPLSYMYQGKVATQSDVPKLSIDPTLGTAQQANLTQEQPLVDAKVSETKSRTKGQDLKNEVQQGINQWLKQFSPGNTDEAGNTSNNQQHLLNLDRDTREAAKFVKQYERKMKAITLDVENELFNEGVPQEIRRQTLYKVKEDIKKLGLQSGLLDQLRNMREFDEWLNKTVTENIHSLPQWVQALTAILLKLQSYR